MTERESFKKQFQIGYFRMKASAYKTGDGKWKIASIGSVGFPTALLPFEVTKAAMDLVRSGPYETENQLKAALLDAR